MKMITLILVLSSSMTYAHDLVNCRLYKDGTLVQEIESFNIEKFETKNPEATVDGGLLSYETNKTEVLMSFSNECDNSYDITFQKSDLKKAKAGNLATVVGKAHIYLAAFNEDASDLVVDGDLVCGVALK